MIEFSIPEIRAKNGTIKRTIHRLTHARIPYHFGGSDVMRYYPHKTLYSELPRWWYSTLMRMLKRNER